MYNTTVDSWSVGCVLAEMICQAALLPGKTANDQMFRIVQLLGPPNEAERCAVCPDLETNRIIRAVRDHWPGMSATERLRTLQARPDPNPSNPNPSPNPPHPNPSPNPNLKP